MAVKLPRFNYYQHVRRLDGAAHGAGVIPHAVYILFETDEASRKKYLETLNKNPDVPDDDSTVVKEVYLEKATLEDAFERHGQIIGNESISEPSKLPYQYERFVCLTTPEWEKEGALIVTLVDEGENTPAGFHCKPSEVAAVLANLSISNMDWEDFVESPDFNLDYNEEEGSK